MKRYRIKPRCWVIRIVRGPFAGEWFLSPNNGTTRVRDAAHPSRSSADAHRRRRNWDGTNHARVFRRGRPYARCYVVRSDDGPRRRWLWLRATLGESSWVHSQRGSREFARYATAKRYADAVGGKVYRRGVPR